MDKLTREVLETLQTREQRLRELRDMTQDGNEISEIDAELRSIQLTLSDLAEMDEASLQSVIERYARTHPMAAGLGREGQAGVGAEDAEE
jgi:hypothetical protein